MKYIGIIIGLLLIFGIIGTCRSDRDGGGGTSSGSTSASRHGITQSEVIRNTKLALELAQKASGVKATGFAVDHCIIGDDKAVCHFHCYVGGVRHIGGIGFDIRDGKLIPDGRYYLDADI